MHETNEDSISSLTDLLDRLEKVSDEEEVEASVDDVLKIVGRRSFGTMLLLAGLITSMPLVGDIPGMSATMGLFVIFISVQLLMRREYFWMPKWLLNRSIDPDKLKKGVGWARTPASKVDHVLGPRMEWLTHGRGTLVVAVICTMIGLAMPAMEFIPFSATAAGVALLAYGLGLVFNDGWLILAAHVVAAGTIALAIMGLV